MMSMLHTEKQVQLAADTIMKQVADAADKAAGPDASPDAKAKVADFEKQALEMIDAQVSWKAMQTQFTDVYAKAFTEEQLDAIIGFYKSPAGVALLAGMPDVNAQLSKFGQGRVQALQPQIQQLYADFKKSLAPPPPMPGPACGPSRSDRFARLPAEIARTAAPLPTPLGTA
jgi:hypothetical protein